MSAPDRSPPAPRLRMQQIIINCRPGALTAESDWVAHRYIWQLAGVVEDMSIFEGVIAYVESDPSSPSLPPGVPAGALAKARPRSGNLVNTRYYEYALPSLADARSEFTTVTGIDPTT